MKKIVLLAFVLVLLSTAVVVRFIRSAVAEGIIYIRSDGSVEGTGKIQRDGNVYTFTDNINDEIVVERDNIMVDGAGYTLQGAGSGTGMDLSSRSNVTIKNMEIKAFTYGIWLDDSSKNTLFGNNITNNVGGIILDSSLNNIISRNNITNNSYYAICLRDSSDNNLVSGNSITNNGYGIYLWGGGFGEYTNYNSIYHNNFIDNTQQVYMETSGYVNFWDDGYPSGGNYWSDYAGVDADGDGIGDKPYTIDTNNNDGYPLMDPWTPPEHDLVVSITAPAYLQFGDSSSLDAIVINEGLNDEVDVELMLFINGTVVDSITVPLLKSYISYALFCIWTPTVKGTYNVTAYAYPVPSEASVENNQKTKFVTVAEIVGIKAGDWIKYDYAVSGVPSGTPLPTWMKMEFLSVEGTGATVRGTMHMSDGTEQNQTMTVDIVAGEGTLGTFSGFVIPANRTTGDTIYISGYGNITIDGETTRTYAGARRTVVYASFSQDGTQLTYYWDKQTGVMVEASVTSGDMTGTAKATETNMWEAALAAPFWMEWWFLTIIGVIIILGTGSAVVLLRRRKPPLPEEATPAPTK